MDTHDPIDLTDHPLLIPDGYQIYTKPTEYVANFIRSNIAQGHHGCSSWGGGWLGKTTTLQFLSDNAPRWLVNEHRQQIGIAASMVMPSGTRRSDRQFWSAMNQRMKQPSATRLDAGTAMERLVNLICTRCGQARQRRMVLFIDNAQRITDGEFQYLEDLDGRIREEKLALFLVLMRQSDAEGVDIGDDWLDRPSHTVRRWFMETTPFRPLQGIVEVTHAMSRYDRAATHPTPDMSFTRAFARRAFDEKSWTLAREAPKVMTRLGALRSRYRLPASEAWPMATFTLTVRNLLLTAHRDPHFAGFNDAQIDEAILNSGYLRLEYVRAKMRMPDQIAQQIAHRAAPGADAPAETA